MDAVYIYKDAGIENEELLRYSIRSLREHCIDLENIYIVGDAPGILPSVPVINATDQYTEKWKNIYHKTQVAARSETVSDPFFLCHDDFFWNEPFEAKEYPFYAKKGGNGGTSGVIDFSVHTAYRVYKTNFLEIPLPIDIKGSYNAKTFYANFMGATPTWAKSNNIRFGSKIPGFDTQVKGKPFFTAGDYMARIDTFIEWLEKKFPVPSPEEKSPTSS